MPLTIGSNIASLAAQRYLGRATATLGESSERLASGMRVNRATDDAAGLSIASGLHVNRRVFLQGVRNLGDGVSLLNVAETATGTLSDILIRQKELAEQAANGTYTTAQRSALDREAQALYAEYNRVVASVSFNGLNPLQIDEIVLQAGYGVRGTYVIQLGSESTVTTNDGTFQGFAVTGLPDFTFVGSSTFADVNGDGKLDVLASTDTDSGNARLQVSLGNGNGTFQSPVQYSNGSGAYSRSVIAFDFDGDGDTDIAATNQGANEVGLFFNDGSGTFSVRQALSVAGPYGLAVGDVNGDGVKDLVAEQSGGNMYVFLGTGTGTFTPNGNYNSGRDIIQLGDVDNDGDLDIVGTTPYDPSIAVTLNIGNGTFNNTVVYSAGGTGDGYGLRLGFIDGDAYLDAVVGIDNGVRVLHGVGNGTFALAQSLASGAVNSFGRNINSNQIELKDVSGDGIPDILDAKGSGNLNLFLGSASGAFGPRQILNTAGLGETISVAVGDVNGDGAQDLLTATNDVATDFGVALGNAHTVHTVNRITPLASISIATRANALAALDAVDTAAGQVRAVRNTIGTAMSRLAVGSANLQQGAVILGEAEGRIVDADIAETSAGFLKAQIQQKVAAAVLGQANQIPALALRLLQP